MFLNSKKLQIFEKLDLHVSFIKHSQNEYNLPTLVIPRLSPCFRSGDVWMSVSSNCKEPSSSFVNKVTASLVLDKLNDVFEVVKPLQQSFIVS